jgi:hypothetical protein
MLREFTEETFDPDPSMPRGRHDRVLVTHLTGFEADWSYRDHRSSPARVTAHCAEMSVVEFIRDMGGSSTRADALA